MMFEDPFNHLRAERHARPFVNPGLFGRPSFPKELNEELRRFDRQQPFFDQDSVIQ